MTVKRHLSHLSCSLVPNAKNHSCDINRDLRGFNYFTTFPDFDFVVITNPAEEENLHSLSVVAVHTAVSMENSIGMAAGGPGFLKTCM